MDAGMNKHGLYDIYEVWHVPFWQTKTFFYAMLFFGLIILSLIFWLIVKKIRKKEQQTSWEVALRQLNALQQSDIRVEHGKEFYCALTSIVKKYLQDRFDYHLVHKTDTESIAYLETNELLAQYRDDVCSIFSGIQVIKFANARVAQEQMLNDLHLSIQLVERTAEHKK